MNPNTFSRGLRKQKQVSEDPADGPGCATDDYKTSERLSVMNYDGQMMFYCCRGPTSLPSFAPFFSSHVLWLPPLFLPFHHPFFRCTRQARAKLVCVYQECNTQGTLVVLFRVRIFWVKRVEEILRKYWRYREAFSAFMRCAIHQQCFPLFSLSVFMKNIEMRWGNRVNNGLQKDANKFSISSISFRLLFNPLTLQPCPQYPHWSTTNV